MSERSVDILDLIMSVLVIRVSQGIQGQTQSVFSQVCGSHEHHLQHCAKSHQAIYHMTYMLQQLTSKINSVRHELMCLLHLCMS